MLRAILLVLVAVLLTSQSASSQDSSSLYSKILHFPDKLFKKVNAKSEDINKRLKNQTEKYLHRLAKEEGKLKKKLAKKDSTAAKRIFDDAQHQYADWLTKINEVSGKASTIRNKYIPHLDTLKTAFSFIEKSDGLLKKTEHSQAQLKSALSKMDGLQDKFNQAEEIKKFIQERRHLLKEQLAKYGLGKELKKLQKQVYYYQAQVDEYKQLFDDPSKLESKAIEVLQKTQAFKDFFSKHSQLAGLFRLPGNSSGISNISLAGLQTREGIQQELVQRFGSGPNVKRMMQQQVQAAQAALSTLKDKLNKAGSGSSDKEMPDFKPNNQKTKQFKDRLELGTNLQTVKSSHFFPLTTDIGLSVGYKLNDKSIIGFGGAYKIGLGKDISHINISHQGIGARTFVDYKIKGSFWVSGGAEMNYRRDFKNFEILNDYRIWQKSALLGLTKKYQVSKKVKGNVQLMYDFLWEAQVPRAQAVVFRIGYNL